MNIAIKPVSIFGFGLADTLLLRLINDDLSASATFFYQLGKTEGAAFTGAPLAIGNVSIGGADYAGWNGSSTTIAALVLPNIPGGVLAAA